MIPDARLEGERWKCPSEAPSTGSSQPSRRRSPELRPKPHAATPPVPPPVSLDSRLSDGQAGDRERRLSSSPWYNDHRGETEMTEIAPRIVVDPGIRFGKPVIRGTRVPVDLVVAQLAGGMTMEKVCEEYGLTREDVLAALSYAARFLAEEQVRAVE